MTRMWIVVGDATESGGRVVTGSPYTDIDGKPVARVADRATCLRHMGAFPIVDGDDTVIIDGQPAARHGSSLACGCKVLAVQQNHVFTEMGSSGGLPEAVLRAGQLPLKSVLSPSFDGGFVLRSSLTGEPLANRRYRVVHADGAAEDGVTDAEGATHIVTSNCCEMLRIELEEEGP